MLRSLVRISIAEEQTFSDLSIIHASHTSFGVGLPHRAHDRIGRRILVPPMDSVSYGVQKDFRLPAWEE